MPPSCVESWGMSSYTDYEPRPNARERQLIGRVLFVLVHFVAALFLGCAISNYFWIESHYFGNFIDEFAPLICLYGSWGFALGQISVVSSLVALARIFPPVKVGAAVLAVALLMDAYLFLPIVRDSHYLADRQLPDEYVALQLLGQICLAVTLAAALVVNGVMKARMPGQSWLCRGRSSPWQLNIRDVLLTTVIVAVFVGITRQRFSQIWEVVTGTDLWDLCLPVIHLAVVGPMAAYVGFSALLGHKIRWRLLFLLTICFAQLAAYFGLYRNYIPFYGSRDLGDAFVREGLACCTIVSMQMLTVYFSLKCLRALGVRAVTAQAAANLSQDA